MKHRPVPQNILAETVLTKKRLTASFRFEHLFHTNISRWVRIFSWAQSEQPDRDVITVNILVMDGDWPNEVRSIVISNIYKCLTSILEVEEPSPNWWVSFQVIEDGSWGSRGGVLSILDLVESRVFTDEKIKAIRKNMLPE
ncbi:tautomerase enzyme [Paenibacillus hubeiensis]|uniref:tautomerase enzyme n=1 Tax=Paenibacillus hubeiensis TaxID=3077330 RepID=UPI0031BAD9BC